MIEDVVEMLRKHYGDEWTRNDDANLDFTLDVGRVIRGVTGAHLIGEPEVDDGEIILNIWVDHPINDLMSADQLAYNIFGRISDEIFYAERRFDEKSIRYPFVTGSSLHGHAGSLVLAGPHAADFADRHQIRDRGSVRFDA